MLQGTTRRIQWPRLKTEQGAIVRKRGVGSKGNMRELRVLPLKSKDAAATFWSKKYRKAELS